MNELILKFLQDIYSEDFVEYDEKEGCIYVDDEDANIGYKITVEITN